MAVTVARQQNAVAMGGRLSHQEDDSVDPPPPLSEDELALVGVLSPPRPQWGRGPCPWALQQSSPRCPRRGVHIGGNTLLLRDGSGTSIFDSPFEIGHLNIIMLIIIKTNVLP